MFKYQLQLIAFEANLYKISLAKHIDFFAGGNISEGKPKNGPL